MANIVTCAVKKEKFIDNTKAIHFDTDMETELPQVQVEKKEPKRRPAAKKKTLSVVSDDDDVEIIDDDDFEPEAKNKKGGRKPANAKAAAKPPTGAKKRGPASKQQQVLGQKLITEVLKPAAESSPEKKVRKMRASPFNKKSSSILGRGATSIDDEENDGETSKEQENSASTVGSVTDVAARPKRVNRRQTSYVISDDSESEAAEEDIDDSDASEDSDFDDE